MTNSEAEKIIERLKNACTFNKFDEPGVWGEYIRYLRKYNYETMDKAVDIAIESDSKNVPAISQLNKHYHEQKDSQRNSVTQNEKYCPVCDDRGFGFITKKTDKGTYMYVLYCPFCEKGKSYAYDGRECKDKSPYYVEPLTKYYSDAEINEMRLKNLERMEQREERNAIRMEGVIDKIGQRV